MPKLLFKYFIYLIIFSSQIALAKSPKIQLTIQLNAAINARETFIPIFEKFEKITNIKITTSRYLYDDELNSNNLTKLPDISYSHDSKRLQKFILLDLVEPITDSFHKNNLSEQFPPSVIDWISYQEEVYGIPYSQTTWGVYYKKSTIKKFGKIPTQWQPFIDYCLRIKKAGYALFPTSRKQTWHATGWFQYFIIRMYDNDFYLNLINGKTSYHSPKIQAIFKLWQDAIHKGLYTYDYDDYKWNQYVPLLLRDYISFIFISNNFGDKVFTQKIFDDISFMPFPQINETPRQEVSPISLFFINKTSKQKDAAKRFLMFIAEPENQAVIAENIFVLPPNVNAPILKHNIQMKAYRMLQSANNLSPFFDRAVPLAFDKPSAKALTDFIYDADIEKLTLKMETLRLKHYSN